MATVADSAVEAKCFAFVFPLASGHINPSFPLARALVALGHEVHYLCREQMREAIEGTGARFHSEIEALSELYEGREPDIHGAIPALARERGIQSQSVMDAKCRFRNVELELMLPGLVRWMQQLRPSAVVYCPLLLESAGFAAKFLGIPNIALMTIAGPGSIPKTLVEFMAMCTTSDKGAGALAMTYPPNLLAIARLRINYGLWMSPLELFWPFGKLSVLSESSLTLVTTCEDLQDPMPEELAESYRRDGVRFEFVGPLLDEAGAKRAAGIKLKQEEATLSEPPLHDDVVTLVRNAKAAGRQVILVSMGTVITGDSPDYGWEGRKVGADGKPRGLTGRELCQAAWAGVFDVFGTETAEEGALIVVSLGPQQNPLGDVVPPANAVCMPIFPQVDLLKAGVDVFLTHGGQNSFTEGLAEGTPLVVCPGFADQHVNARKAETLGVGVHVVRPDPDAGCELAAAVEYRASVADALRRVNSEPHFAEAARQCAKRLAAAGGVPRAVELLLSTASAGVLRGAVSVEVPDKVAKRAKDGCRASFLAASCGGA